MFTSSRTNHHNFAVVDLDMVVESIEAADLLIAARWDIIVVDMDRTVMFAVEPTLYEVVENIELVVDRDYIVADMDRTVAVVVVEQTLVVGELVDFDWNFYRHTFYINNNIQSTSTIGINIGYNLKFNQLWVE